MPRSKKNTSLLQGARVYLSGPMDFVASRATEKQYGWRNRLSQFLQEMGVTVFDPWFKPGVRGMHEYGREDIKSGDRIKERWTYDDGEKGARERAWCAHQFWETLHIDLRMVDTSDFTISYCPTNIYSVGTPHEVILARTQFKPVLFVSPPVVFPSLHKLRKHLENDANGAALLKQLEMEIPVKENARGIPSAWYMPLVGGDNFFDGFGFAKYRKRFGWREEIPLDIQEKQFPPKRPLLPFVEKLNKRLPKKWDDKLNRFVANDDWLLWDFHQKNIRGKHAEAPMQNHDRQFDS